MAENKQNLSTGLTVQIPLMLELAPRFKQAPRFELAPLLRLKICNKRPPSNKRLPPPPRKNEFRYSVYGLYGSFNEMRYC